MGQVPMLELADGQKLVQSRAILNYVGTVHNLKPKENFQVSRGESIQYRFENDWQYKYFNYPVWYAPAHGQEAAIKSLQELHIPKFLKEL